METSINYNERLEALIKRRGVNISETDIKYRGKLTTTKFMAFEAAKKSHLLKNLNRNLLDI